MAQVALDRPTTHVVERRRARVGLLATREIMLIGAGLVAYRMVRYLVRDDLADAFTNAQRVIDWERAVGIFNEVSLQSTILGSHPVVFMLNRYYFIAHFLGTAILLTWLFVRHHDRYGQVRRVLFAVTMGGLAIHVAFPLAPPRWFPEMGFVDTLQTYGPKVYDSDAVASTANQIAAMPSLHVAWALLGAWAVVSVLDSRWRWLAMIHPITMSLAVVVTANHWWLDVVVAALLVVLAFQADRPLQQFLSNRTDQRLAISLRESVSHQPSDSVSASTS